MKRIRDILAGLVCLLVLLALSVWVARDIRVMEQREERGLATSAP